jgi:hypothetical protein
MEAIHDRHRHVHEDNIRLQRGRARDGRPAVRRFADHVEIGVRPEDRLQPLADRLVIVCRQNGHACH